MLAIGIQTIPTLGNAWESHMVSMPAERDGLLGMSAHGDGSEDTNLPVVHKLGGDVDQGVAVENQVEVVVDEFWAFAEMLIGVKYGRIVVVRQGAVEGWGGGQISET